MLPTPRANCAVFVDFENIYLAVKGYLEGRPQGSPADVTMALLSRLKRKIEEEMGMNFIMGRAYGNWEYSETQEALNSLAMMSFDPQYGINKAGKNSADLELSLAVQEVLLTRGDINHFFIVGGDRDYIPIVRRIRERAKGVTVVCLEGSASGDLRNIVGRGHFLPAETLIGDLLGRDAPAETPPSEVEGDGAIDAKAYITDANMELCLRLIEEATRKYRTEEVWLVPFLKNRLNEAFLTLTNEERKEILNSLHGMEAIKIEKRPGTTGDYSVIILNREHPMVAKAVGG
ncbi:MAG: NYN domain-containing protein [Euryarchaeota archaeon]|nr:NYN domain-containing protein [Euryarchaeota archaeon]